MTTVEEMMAEMDKCQEDPQYFMDKYCRVKENSLHWTLPEWMKQDADIVSCRVNGKELRWIVRLENGEQKANQIWSDVHEEASKATINTSNEAQRRLNSILLSLPDHLKP